MTRAFTGRHMAAILVAFFAVVIAVNVTMARLASRTFGGVVVENSYVASQRFDGWLAAARAQDRAGWRATTGVDAGRLSVTLTRRSAIVADAALTAIVRHPLGRLPDRTLMLRWNPSLHRYVATESLPAGRWLIEIAGRRGATRLRFADETRA